ncbi:Hypothetical predicted protein [Octopus vulgaris]|uniref:Protein MFI-like n=1 Tax=Octopus vulgaris TaxID=6645 RepID=A0AA36FFP5_OCTVU|nr:Hypothetical predicted protein [Octopus vulgaris]
MNSFPDLDEAATKIQRKWRSFIDQQIFKYYKDILNFKNCGNPALMLQCINPIEADLLDAASGNKVRFRLGGSSFPPNVYYKIYTERNIIDVCAISPKNYCTNNMKLPLALHSNNKQYDIFLAPKNDMSDWYRRTENNGWRLVSGRILYHYKNDRLTLESSQTKYLFHPSKLKRKQNAEQRKKLLQIEWKKKLYRGDFEKLSSEEDHCEANNLLDWVEALDFEGYIKDWKFIGTTKSGTSICELGTTSVSSHAINNNVV